MYPYEEYKFSFPLCHFWNNLKVGQKITSVPDNSFYREIYESRSLFIAVHSDFHWFLCIVVNLQQWFCDEETSSNNFRGILLLDSLNHRGKKNPRIDHVQNHLYPFILSLIPGFNIELKEPLSEEMLKKKYPIHDVDCFKQSNGYDCGLFLLQNIRYSSAYISNPISNKVTYIDGLQRVLKSDDVKKSCEEMRANYYSFLQGG